MITDPLTFVSIAATILSPVLSSANFAGPDSFNIVHVAKFRCSNLGGGYDCSKIFLNHRTLASHVDEFGNSLIIPGNK